MDGQPDPAAFPRVDDQLVRPETREELVRGRAGLAAAAKAPHADRQADVVSLARNVAAKGYVSSTELLTRAGPQSDFATDACIRREGIDPATGARYLEELVFEVVSEQSVRDMTERAEDLTTRGVRRVIAIFIKKGEVREWSAERSDWTVLDPNGTVEDPTLVEPIPIRALLDGAGAERTVVRALYAKREPELMAIEAKAREEGLALSRAAIEALCDAYDIPLDPERRALLQTLDAERLKGLLDEIRTEHRWP